MGSLLDIRIRRKTFGGRLILQDVHLQVARGEIVALVGASGCGKSTLLRIVAGLERDHDGEVRLQGERLREPTPDVGFIFQEPRLFPWLDVAHNVAFDSRRAGADRASIDARVAELLAEVGLEGLARALPKQLSGGQAQRVAIARGLFKHPQVLLLDEPFSAVDAFTRMKLQDLLLRLAHRHGITVLLVTHDIDEAVHLADRVVVMSSNPGTLSAVMPIPLARPRDPERSDASASIAQVREALHAVHAM